MSFICHIHNYTEYNQQWNVFSAFNPSKCTHTRSSGQPILRRPGNSWGFSALLKVSPQSHQGCGFEIRTNNLGLPRVSNSTHYPLGHDCQCFWSIYVLVMNDSCGQLYERGSCQSCMQVISWAPVKDACPFSKFSIPGGRIKVNLMPFNSHDWLSREHLQKSLKVQHLKYYLLIQQSWVWNFAYWSYWGTAAKYASLSWVVWSNWCMQSQRRGSKKTVEITLHLFSVVCSSDSSSCFTRGRPP